MGKNVFENEKGETIFYLKNNINASKVFLSGNFNNWKENTNPMQKTDSGWIAKINLKPGKYFYKFIVEGTRKLADEMAELERTMGKYNSEYQFSNAPPAFLAFARKEWIKYAEEKMGD